MNAVNLIPEAGGVKERALSLSPQTLAVIGGLLATLVAVALYVSAVNSVTARKGQLARVTATAAQWRALGNAYSPYVSASQQRSQQLAAVRQLASARFPWPRLLDQLGRAMPADAALSSLQAGAGAGGSAPTPASQQSVQLTGCASSQSKVADTMQQLRLVDGVSSVVLSSSNDSAASVSTGSAAPSNTATAGAGTCSYPVQFQMTLTLNAPVGGTATSTKTGAQ